MNEEKKEKSTGIDPVDNIIQDSDQFEDIGQSTSRSFTFTLSSGRTFGSPTTIEVLRIQPSYRVETGWGISTNPSDFSNSNSVIVTVTEPSGGASAGSYTVRLRHRTGSFISQAFNVLGPPVVLTAAWSNVSYTGGLLQGTLTFTGGPANEITASDFEILEVVDGSDVLQNTGWVISTSASVVQPGVGVTISANPVNNTTGSFKIRLKARSVKGGGSANNNSPVSAVTSDAVTVNKGIALVYSSDFDVSSQIRDGFTRFWADSDGSKIYVRGPVGTSGGTNNNIRRYTLSGTYEAAGDINEFSNAARPSGLSFRFDLQSGLPSAGLVYYDNNFYTIQRWYNFRDRAWAITLERYNTSFVHQSTATTISNATTGYQVFDLYDNKIYLIGNSGLEIRNISDGNLISGTSSIPNISQQNAWNSVAVTSNRIYLTTHNENLYVYNHSGVAISTESVFINSINTIYDSFVQGSNLGFASIVGSSPNFSPEIYIYSGIPQPPVVLTAAWSNVSYTGGKLTGTLTFSGGNATGISASDFEIVNNATPPVPQTTGWTFDTPNATATAGTGITISATPPSGRNERFKIRLKDESVRGPRATEDNSPDGNVDSSAALVDTRPAVVATATWSAVSYCATSNKLQGTLTFNNAVTGITASDFEIRNSTNVLQTGWTFDTPSTTAAANTGITIAATAPSARNGSFKIRLKEDSVLGPRATEGNSPASDVDTSAIAVDNRPVVAVSHFRPKLTTTAAQQAATREFELDFDRDIDATALTSADFTISNTAVTFASVSPTTGTEDTYTVTVNQPNNAGGNYTITLAANAVPAKDNAYKAGPATTSTASASFERRSAITASWTEPTGDQTGATAAFTLTFNHSIPATQLSTSDFTVTDDHSIAISPTTGNASVYTITVTHPSTGTGDYTVSLNADTVDTGTTYLEGPDNAVTTSTITYDRRPRVSVSSDTLPATEQDGATVQFTLTFDRSVPATELTNTDFTLTGGASIAATGAINANDWKRFCLYNYNNAANLWKWNLYSITKC